MLSTANIETQTISISKFENCCKFEIIDASSTTHPCPYVKLAECSMKCERIHLDCIQLSVIRDRDRRDTHKIVHTHTHTIHHIVESAAY